MRYAITLLSHRSEKCGQARIRARKSGGSRCSFWQVAPSEFSKNDKLNTFFAIRASATVILKRCALYMRRANSKRQCRWSQNPFSQSVSNRLQFTALATCAAKNNGAATLYEPKTNRIYEPGHRRQFLCSLASFVHAVIESCMVLSYHKAKKKTTNPLSFLQKTEIFITLP